MRFKPRPSGYRAFLLLAIIVLLLPQSASAADLYPTSLPMLVEGLTGFAVADFDEDGQLDVLTVSFLDTSTIFLGNGDGTFSPGQTLPFGDSRCSVVVGDWNGDGHQDAAVLLPHDGRLEILVGHGSGDLTSTQSIVVAQASFESTSFSEMLTDDLDGDNIPDLVFTWDLTTPGAIREISLCFGTGTGTFGPVQTIDVGFDRPAGLALADFDEDGILDILTTSRSVFVSFRYVLLKGLGGGVFSAGAVGSGARGVFLASGDFTGDGHQDALSEQGDLLVGDGSGGFTVIEDAIAGPTSVLSEYPFRLTCDDFDEDGVTDIANGLFGIFLGQNGAFVESQSNEFLSDSALVASGDFDGDQQVDLLIGNPNGTLTFHRGDGAGSAGLSGLPFPTVQLAAAVAVGDFNADGNPDVATNGSSEISVLLGDGQGTFTTDLRFPHIVDIGMELLARDINEDGHLDLMALNEGTGPQSQAVFFRGDGSGQFVAESMFRMGSSPRAFVSEDLDGDGHLDLAISSQFDERLQIRYGDGTGDFGGLRLVALPDRPIQLASGDLNQDGRADFVVGYSSSLEEVSVVLSAPGRTFLPPQNIPIQENGFPVDIQIVDLDDDGILDLVLTDLFDLITTYRGDGTGTFVLIDSIPTPDNPRESRIADLNRDGFLDILTSYDRTRMIGAFLGTPTGFTDGGNYYSRELMGRLEVGDFDRDGQVDAVTTGRFDVQLFLNQALDPVECFRGTVNQEAAGGIATDVLFVNGSAGTGDDRRVTLQTQEDITVSLTAAPAGPFLDVPYVLFAWPGASVSPTRLVFGTVDLGCLVNRLPRNENLSGSLPFRCARAAVIPPSICNGIREINGPTAGPWSLTKVGGLSLPTTLLIQAIVRDESVSTQPRYSLSNAVTLEVTN